MTTLTDRINEIDDMLYRTRHFTEIAMHAMDFGNGEVPVSSLYCLVELLHKDAERASDGIEHLRRALT